MTGLDWIMVGSALVAIVVAAVLSAVDAALTLITPTRAERMVAEGQPGAAAVKEITDDPAPEVTTAHFLQVLCEVAAIVLVCLVAVDNFQGLGTRLVVSITIMGLVAFIAWGWRRSHWVGRTQRRWPGSQRVHCRCCRRSFGRSRNS